MRTLSHTQWTTIGHIAYIAVTIFSYQQQEKYHEPFAEYGNGAEHFKRL